MTRILFITPIDPEKSENGLALRAGHLARALKALGDVETRVVPVAEPGKGRAEDPDPEQSGQQHVMAWLSEPRTRTLLTEEAGLPERCKEASPAIGQQLLRRHEKQAFDVVYVFRLYLAGAVAALFEAWPRCRFILDIDEDDAHMLEQIACLQAEAGNHSLAGALRQEAAHYSGFASHVMKWFDAIVCSSTLECERVRAANPPLPADLPLFRVRNVYPGKLTAPVPARKNRRAPSPFNILLVGNLAYWPNLDAARWLISDILPPLCLQVPGAHAHIVGSGGLDAPSDQVTIHGHVPKLAELYRRADVCLVPLRAGGGSRLKLLEAFARGVPVIATTKAAEGLNAEPGLHFMLADSTGEFVRQASLLASDPTLASRLAKAARDWVEKTHSPARMREDMAVVLEAATL